MRVDVARAALEFLSRTQLTGVEVVAYNAVVEAILPFTKEEVNHSEDPEVKD